MSDDELFTIANGAFDLFSIPERRLALEEFARLRYPSITDRFMEAVHNVITKSASPQAGPKE